MSFVRNIKNRLDSSDLLARKLARREARQREVYSQVQDALAGATSGEFEERHAHAWSYNEDRGASRKIQGHPGSAAQMYVSETLGEFTIHGSTKTKFSGMTREAGFGAHGITEGTVTVDVEIRPIRGMTQVIEVPVAVKNGYMLQPGLVYHHGVPMVLSQSALDELMDAAAYGDELTPDRRHMYSPGKNASSDVPPWLNKDEDEDEEDSDEASEEGEDKKAQLGPPMPPPAGGVPAVAAPGKIPLGKSREEYEKAMRDWEERNNPGGQGAADIKAKERRKRLQRERQQLENPAQGLKVGSLQRLAVEITIPDTGDVLPEGSRVFVVAETADGLIVKHEDGTEALIHPSFLSA